MASSVSTEKYGSRQFVYSYDHDPGATTAVVCSPDGGTTLNVVDFSKYKGLMVIAKPNVVGGNGITKLEIIASAAATMTSPTVIKDSGAIQADALNDNYKLECIAEEVQNELPGARYVAARITMATATDEATVTYIADPVFPRSGLTPADSIS